VNRERAATGEITALVEARERGDVAYLVEHLADTNQEIRWIAANSLRKLGSAEAVEPLLRIAENAADESFRVLALKAVGEAGDTSACPRLRALADGDAPIGVRVTGLTRLPGFATARQWRSWRPSLRLTRDGGQVESWSN
jgi:HEAT repeat protein